MYTPLQSKPSKPVPSQKKAEEPVPTPRKSKSDKRGAVSSDEAETRTTVPIAIEFPSEYEGEATDDDTGDEAGARPAFTNLSESSTPRRHAAIDGRIARIGPGMSTAMLAVVKWGKVTYGAKMGQKIPPFFYWKPAGDDRDNWVSLNGTDLKSLVDRNSRIGTNMCAAVYKLAMSHTGNGSVSTNMLIFDHASGEMDPPSEPVGLYQPVPYSYGDRTMMMILTNGGEVVVFDSDPSSSTPAAKKTVVRVATMLYGDAVREVSWACPQHQSVTGRNDKMYVCAWIVEILLADDRSVAVKSIREGSIKYVEDRLRKHTFNMFKDGIPSAYPRSSALLRM